LEDFQNVYSVNVFGAAMMAKHAANIFKKQNYGNIINISSTAGTKGFAHGTVYASSKFALRGMTQCWQAELRKHNVRVILINPSEVITAFGSDEGKQKEEVPNKLRAFEIAHTIVSTLEMDDRGFIPETTVWATNPF
jgi:3-oxoacyl-[acyl-carrier protein] reductase